MKFYKLLMFYTQTHAKYIYDEINWYNIRYKIECVLELAYLHKNKKQTKFSMSSHVIKYNYKIKFL